MNKLKSVKNRYIEIKNKNIDEYVKSEKDAEKFAYGLNFCKLFWVFLIGCVAGTVLETFWAFITLGRFEIRTGLVIGPFIPVYGGGAVLMTVFFYRLYKLHDVAIFAISALLGSSFEFLCSFLQEKIVGTISWDYSGTFLNIGGRTNFMFGFIWGLLGLSWVRFVYPSLSRFIEKIPKKIGYRLTVILVMFMLIDSLLSVAAIWRQNERSQGIPSSNSIENFLDSYLDDDYLDFVYPHMSRPDNKK